MLYVRLLLALLALLACAVPVRAQAPESAPQDEAAIHALIDAWYAEQRGGPDGRPRRLLAPGAIDASPAYAYADTGAASVGPHIYHSLASTALAFNHEITQLVIDPRFARVGVWERGYIYAWAAQRTNERAGSATFVLEKQADGAWLVLAHHTQTVGIPPNRRTEPMPDLRDLFYAPKANTAIRKPTPAPAPRASARRFAQTRPSALRAKGCFAPSPSNRRRTDRAPCRSADA